MEKAKEKKGLIRRLNPLLVLYQKRSLMKRNAINVSDEYVKELCEWMLKWADSESSLTIPQMQQERGLCNFYWGYLKNYYPSVKENYELVKAKLHNRWLIIAMTNKELPQHQAKILMRYLGYYDADSRQMLLDEKKEANQELPKEVHHHYETENYANHKLEGIYQDVYDRNANKRGSGKKAK